LGKELSDKLIEESAKESRTWLSLINLKTIPYLG
jgi:hypothetical protein